MKRLLKKLQCFVFGHRFFTATHGEYKMNIYCSVCHIADEEYMVKLVRDLERHKHPESCGNE